MMNLRTPFIIFMTSIFFGLPAFAEDTIKVLCNDGATGVGPVSGGIKYCAKHGGLKEWWPAKANLEVSFNETGRTVVQGATTKNVSPGKNFNGETGAASGSVKPRISN